MIRKWGIFATIIFVTFLVAAIPVVSEFFDIYNEPFDLDSVLVFRNLPRDESELQQQGGGDSTLDETLEATEIEDYMVLLNRQNEANLSLSQDNYNIVVSGEMNDDKKGNNIHSQKYISFDFYAPLMITDDILQNLRVTLPDSGNEIYTQRENQILERNKKGNLYFTLTQEFMTDQTISVVVDWGDGQSIVYTIFFDVTIG